MTQLNHILALVRSLVILNPDSDYIDVQYGTTPWNEKLYEGSEVIPPNFQFEQTENYTGRFNFVYFST